MNYRIVQEGEKWQAQIKGAYNWIPLQDENGDELFFESAEQAGIEMKRRLTEIERENERNRMAAKPAKGRAKAWADRPKIGHEADCTVQADIIRAEVGGVRQVVR